MATQLKQMKGKEFVDKILAGERDFSRIRLEERFDLSGYEGFGKLQSYLRGQELSAEPICIYGSKFLYIKAKELYLPHVKGKGADLSGAKFDVAILYEADLKGADLSGAILSGADLRDVDFSGADLSEADFLDADLSGANFKGANLWIAYLAGANLYKADFKGADLEGADLSEAELSGANLYEANLYEAELKRADLEGADLRDVKNLEYVLNLGLATYLETKVTQKEKIVIEKALKTTKMFDVK